MRSMPARARRVDPGLLLAAPAVAFALLIAVSTFNNPVWATSDTYDVVNGTGPLDRCLHHGVFSNCESHYGRVAEFPLLQYLPTLAAKRLGSSRADALRNLIVLSAASFLGLLALLALVGRRAGAAAGAPLLVLVGLAGMLVWYSEWGFAESLAALLTLLVACAAIWRWPPAVAALLTLVAGISKEPAPPLLVALALLALSGSFDQRARRTFIGVVIGAALAVMANTGFNVFRYGTLYNAWYAQPGFATPGVGLKAGFFAALGVSPNGGILWFWPTAVGLIAVTVIAGRRAGAHPARIYGPAILPASLALVFATRHSPFGWSAWGPRYFVPWLPAIAAVGWTMFPRHSAEVLRGLARRPLAWAACGLVVIVLSVPQVNAFRDVWVAFDGFTEPGCEVKINVPAPYNPHYYSCVERLAWTHPPLLAKALTDVDSPVDALYDVLFVAAAGGLLLLARRQLLGTSVTTA
ncbi:MAG: hypothetical protein ACJ76Z_00410 [Thermoleophilaceae bacterium]